MTAHADHTAPRDKEKVPRVLLRAIALLLIATLAMVSWARITGQEPAAMPPKLPIVQERILHIYGTMGGAARVLDEHGQQIADLDGTEGGFVAGISRSLARVRSLQDIPADAPVRLIQYSDGRLGLRDDLSGWRVELIGFGHDNTAAFARLLEDK